MKKLIDRRFRRAEPQPKTRCMLNHRPPRVVIRDGVSMLVFSEDLNTQY